MGHDVLEWDTVVIGEGGARPSKSVEAMTHMINVPACENRFEGLSDLGINDLMEGRDVGSK